jgi:hypothetical protein
MNFIGKTIGIRALVILKKTDDNIKKYRRDIGPVSALWMELVQ